MKDLVKVILYQPLLNALMLLVWLIPGHSVGWAIIVLTVIVRLILLPSSLQALRQQKRMQDLQPEIQAIQDKYKNDKTKLTEELTRFYRVNKINPLGSCLPLLVQLPILFVLYYVFMHGLDKSQFDLLYPWVPQPETIQTNFFGIDLSKPNLWVLPVIAGALQFFQSWQIMPKTKPSGGQQQMAMMMSRQFMYLMPIFTVFIAGRLPAALPLYWSVTTLFGIGQQWWVYRNSKGKEAPSIEKDEKKENKIVKRGVEITVRKKGAK